MTNASAGFTWDTLLRKKIEKRRRKEKDVRVHNRLSALLWLGQGRTPEEVAELLGVCSRTVHNWLQLYQRGGLETLCTLEYHGDPGRLKPSQLDHLKREVATGRFKTAAEACDWVEKTFGRRFSKSGMRKLLQRLGCSFHQVSGFLFKANPDKQQEFLQEYESDKKTAQAEGWRRYFLDGVHPLYGLEVLFCCWLLLGQRFEVGVGGGRKRLNILGAYCPDDREYLDRRYVDKNLNAQSLIELFTLMMARHPQTKRFRIYLDNARYHHAKVLKAWIAVVQQERGVVFDLKHLPAYSPNLNLIERLWKFLRKEALQRWHATFEDMQQAVADVLDNLDRYQSKLDSLMTERFHRSPRVETVVVGVGHAA
jgi:transposase